MKTLLAILALSCAPALHADPIAAPVGITATGNTNGSAVLYWGAVSGAVNYKVYLNESVTAYSLSNIFNVVGLSQGVQYVMGVLAIDADGTESVRSPNVTFTAGSQIDSPNFPLSLLNNSVAQLGAGATFTGGLENTQDMQAAQIEVVADQPITIYVEQFIDSAGAKMSSQDVFTRAAGVPFNENVTIPGNYFRVRVTNNGAGSTTTLAVNTTFGVMSPGPRTVTTLGNNRTALNEVNGTVAASGAGATTAGTLRIVESSDSAVMLSGPASVGPVSVGATMAYLTVTAAGFPSVSFDVITGFAGTIVIEASADGGTTWTGIPFWYGAASAVPTLVTSQVNPATGSNIYVSTGGDSQIRMRPSVYTSGTGSIRGQASQVQVPITNAQTVASTTVTSISAGTNVLGSVTVGFPISGQALSVSSPAFASGIIATNFLKASAAILSKVIVTNTSITTTSSVCVKIYNSASAPAVGAAGPVFRCTQVGPGTTVCDLGPQGIALATGLAYTVTSAVPDVDGTSITAAAAASIIYK